MSRIQAACQGIRRVPSGGIGECRTSKLNSRFAVTNARIGILTNGAQYEFYTDLDAPNKMDEKPFLTLDLEDIDEHVVLEVLKLTKTAGRDREHFVKN